jgi:hypothetical protein
MQADDVASAQQFIDLDLFDRHINHLSSMTLETEDPAAKGIAQSRNLQPDGAASDDP